MARRRALSVREVKAIIRVGITWVDDNLYLQARDDGTRSWLFRYERAGKVRSMGLGPVRRVPLSEARRMAGEHRVAIWNGADPVAERRTERRQEKSREVAVPSATPTFEWCAKEFIAQHEKTLTNEVARKQWHSTMRDYVYPELGHLPVDRIGLQQVHKILEPIWESKHPTATKVRGRIANVLDWAAAKGFRPDNNPARPDSPLDKLLPNVRHKVRHHKAVPWQEMPAVVARLQELGSPSAKALIWTILTAARTSETLLATLDEVDREARLWSLAKERMKADREHRVPLPDAAVALMETLPGGEGYLFPGARKGKPLSQQAMNECLDGIRDDGATVHGFRATFSTWARECTSFSEEVIEHALAHGHKSKVIGAYARTTQLEKRRELMRAWADFVMGI